MNIIKGLENSRAFEPILLIFIIAATASASYLYVLKRAIEKSARKWAGEKSSSSRARNTFKKFPETDSRGFTKNKGRRLKFWASKGFNQWQKIVMWHEDRLIKSGMTESKATSFAWKWCLTISGISILVLIRDIQHPLKGGMLFLGLTIYFSGMTHLKIKERKNTFVTGVYKIYRHMALQLTSGMSSAEVIKHLYESVEEPFLKEAMFGFSSCYFKTMDLDMAAEELTKRIEGDEIHVLATVLRQGLQTGDHYEMVVKQEQLMVKRYYAALAAESEWIRAKGIWIAIGLCLLVFLLLAVPMVYEMGRATQSIFVGK